MPTPADGYRAERLGEGDDARAKALFATMASVFDEDHADLSDAYVRGLLAREDMWILAATLDGEIVGGLTAHVLPLTRIEAREIFIYDVAVAPPHQRRGVGRLLMSRLAELARDAGIALMFVPADDEDTHALEFYRALGGAASRVTFFTLAADGARITS